MTHRCDKGLFDLNKKLRERVAELEKENAELKARPVQQLAPLIRIDPVPQNPHLPITTRCCSSGHLMSYKTTPVQRGPFATGVNLSCDICKNRMTASIGYFRCPSMCDYDLCVRCGMQDPAINLNVQDLQCSNKHVVKFFPTGSSK